MSLSQWSTLYSAESKYSLLVNQSKIQKRLYTYCRAILILLVVLSLLVFNTVSLVIAVTSLFLLLILLDSKPNNIALLELYDEKKVTCGDSNKKLLHVNSRVGFLGCWLVFIDSEGAKKKQPKESTYQLFLFKDQFSAKDYSRLCRYIIKNAQTA